jgi:hypothetical protein
VKFHVTGARAKYTGTQWKEQERAGAGIRESARADSILWDEWNWLMLVSAM